MPAGPNPTLRREVINVYKDLLNLSRDYPLGQAYFRQRLHRAFASQAHLADEAAVRRGIERARFVQKEIEALYYLKRYRTLRQRYGDTSRELPGN